MDPQSRFKAYPSRWYILLIYSLAGLMQGYIWNMWAPIYASVCQLYGWNQTQIALLPFYGTLVFALLVLPSAYFLELIGLRKTMLLMTFLILLGCVLRCFPVGTLATTILVNISAIINGIPGIVTLYLPAYISARWFQPRERKFATAIGALLNRVGLAGSFLIGPAIVKEPGATVTVTQMKREYFAYAWIQTGITAALFLLVLLYYPDRPKSPPSESAEVPRIDYWAGSVKLIKSKDFWLVVGPVTLINGMYSGWNSILPLDFKEKGLSEDLAGNIGFWTSISGAGIGIFTGYVGDLTGELKALLVACCALASLSSAWLVLIMRGFVVFSVRQAYIAAILLGTSCTALLPVNMELAVEACYPVDEPLVVAIIGLISNFTCSVFLIILFFRGIGIAWVDWMLAACLLIGLAMALSIKEKYNRTIVDMANQEIREANERVNDQGVWTEDPFS